MRQAGGLGDALGLWDGNPIKLDCYDHCTTINVINSLSNKKKVKKKKKKTSAQMPPSLFLPNHPGHTERANNGLFFS